jgi:glutathione-regulated potassium-efflux system ancillary protein KefC
MNDSIFKFLIILLAASILIVPLTARLGLGSVIGYLVAGVALGPQGFGLMNSPETILHYSEFGVVLLLFIIGLELHPRRLWDMRRIILGMGTLQIGITTLLIGAALKICGWSYLESLIAGLGLSMSSTAIAMQIIREKSLKNESSGRHGFAVLLFQDLAFIPILLLISLLGAKSAHSDGYAMFRQIAAALLAVVGIVLAVRFFSYPFFRWVSGARVRELSTAFSLLIVVGIAYVMNKVGLSMALGAFLAGVILSDSEYRHEIEANIEPFKGLLLGLFFLAVGMTIKLDLIWIKPLQILAFLFGLLVLKIVALVLSAMIFRVERRHLSVFAILLSQGGEFAFVLFGQAIGERSLAPESAALLNAVVTLSMLTTPLLVLAYYKLQGSVTSGPKPEHDEITSEGAPVILVGFGRMGQIVVRLLKINRINSTVIDHNPDHVDRVRKFGFKAYYGDATQMALLEAAGIAEARLLIITFGDQEMVHKLIGEVKRHHPHIKILARARDRIHAFKLMDLDIDHFERETFGSALSLGERALQLMGVSPFRAHRTVLKFRQYDLASLHKLYKFHTDEKEYISQSRESTAAIERLFAEDSDTLKKPISEESWG